MGCVFSIKIIQPEEKVVPENNEDEDSYTIDSPDIEYKKEEHG